MGGIRRIALLASVVALAGCARLLPGEGRPVESGGTAAPGVAVEGEAPLECGFPSGTVLSYAGRSTTAELDVQEAVGDPMSDDPADIYITRDEFDQGEHHGRLVCAVFVNDPGFVEVTVHPEDGGRFVPPTPYPSVTAPPGGISKVTATDIARAEVPDPSEGKLPTSKRDRSEESSRTCSRTTITNGRATCRLIGGSGASTWSAATREWTY